MNRSISPNFTTLDNTPSELSAKEQVLGHRDLAAEILSFLPVGEVVQHLDAPGTLGEPTIWQEATNTVLRTQDLPNMRLTGEEFGESHKKRVTPILQLIVNDHLAHDLRLNLLQKLHEVTSSTCSTGRMSPLYHFATPLGETLVKLITHQDLSPEMQALTDDVRDHVLPVLLQDTDLGLLATMATHPYFNNHIHAEAHENLSRVIEIETREYSKFPYDFQSQMTSLRKATANLALPTETQQALQALLEHMIPKIKRHNYFLLEDIVNDPNLPEASLQMARQRQEHILNNAKQNQEPVWSNASRYDKSHLEEPTQVAEPGAASQPALAPPAEKSKESSWLSSPKNFFNRWRPGKSPSNSAKADQAKQGNQKSETATSLFAVASRQNNGLASDSTHSNSSAHGDRKPRGRS